MQNEVEPTDTEPSAGEVYGGIVAEIIYGRSRESSYKPKTVLTLSITQHHQPRSPADLTPVELEQLQSIIGNEQLADFMADEENDLEIASVVDANGVTVYRLYGWNYGAGFLFPPTGTALAACATQHEIEHWNRGQRDMFVAMDAALRAEGHRFNQPLSFCWWDDDCWVDLDQNETSESG
ncbi:hypothetical protein ACIHFC_35050 [Streptomyces sp. NPDC052013]|uniref:hypothetical protein n=1 Tax=Streptomyces sp. NPDC052013 TaxID=3365679 RepID=UPI0037D36C49